MKKFVLIALSVFLVSSAFAADFKNCSFKKTEHDTDGLIVTFNCAVDGTTKCYIQRDKKAYGNVESGDVWTLISKKNLLVVIIFSKNKESTNH